jgi:hypothetical protein
MVTSFALNTVLIDHEHLVTESTVCTLYCTYPIAAGSGLPMRPGNIEEDRDLSSWTHMYGVLDKTGHHRTVGSARMDHNDEAGRNSPGR